MTTASTTEARSVAPQPNLAASERKRSTRGGGAPGSATERRRTGSRASSEAWPGRIDIPSRARAKRLGEAPAPRDPPPRPPHHRPRAGDAPRAPPVLHRGTRAQLRGGGRPRPRGHGRLVRRPAAVRLPRRPAPVAVARPRGRGCVRDRHRPRGRRADLRSHRGRGGVPRPRRRGVPPRRGARRRARLGGASCDGDEHLLDGREPRHRDRAARHHAARPRVRPQGVPRSAPPGPPRRGVPLDAALAARRAPPVAARALRRLARSPTAGGRSAGSSPS